jgi:hypothetical protein
MQLKIKDMSTFLVAQNNLTDLENVEKARSNLGIGNMSIQYANNVNITGGSISVSNLVLNNGNATEGAYLVSADDKGTLDWYEPNIKEWTLSNQYDVNISEFVNDMNFVQSNELSNVAFSGSFHDLTDTPTDFSYLYEDNVYLRKDFNLSELTNPESAMSNLGLGPLAFQDNYYVSVSNLFVMSEFRFYPDPRFESPVGKYLALGESNLTRWVSLPVASTTQKGLLNLEDSFSSSNVETAPTCKALKEAYHDLFSRIANTDEATYINDLITQYGLLKRQNNLSELVDTKMVVRSNLGIGSLASQNASDVTVENLTVTDSFSFTNLAAEGAFLRCDNNGSMYWSELPMAQPPINDGSGMTNDMGTPGIVYVMNDFNMEHSELLNYVPTVSAVEALYSTIRYDLDSVRDMIPVAVTDLIDSDDIMLVSDAFKNIDPVLARFNLGLHPVSHTGNYIDIIDRPVNMSQFVNDSHYLESSSNLSDVSDPALAREHLGIGTMSLQNDNDVNIANGVARLETLNITNNFTFKAHGQDESYGKYIRAKNDKGEVEWADIPFATEMIPGLVSLSHDIDDEISLDKVASATAVFKVYTKLLSMIEMVENRVDDLLVKYANN